MFFKKISQAWRTLAFRLTVFYAAITILSAGIALLFIYFMTSAVLLENMNDDLQEDVNEYAALFAAGKLEALIKELENEARYERPEEFFFRLISADSEVILASDLIPWPGLEEAGSVVDAVRASPGILLKTLSFPEKDEAQVVYAELAPGLYLQLGESLDEKEEILEIIVGIFARALILILLLGAVTGWFMARRALAGVEEVTRTARRISKGDFTQRVPLKSRGHEIERLATTFNYMLDRINSLISGIREVTDNIAHDLRSPITSIRGTAETTLMCAESVGEYQQMAGNTIEECDRLLEMINAMLDISEAEAGAEKLEVEEIDITRVVSQACELFQPLAEEKDLTLAAQAPPTCTIRGDRKKIQRLVANLLDNALKYTPPGGVVNVTVRCCDQEAAIDVADNGIGIAKDELAHIFQRFYRCDQSRTQEGTGLGLSLALAIAKAHGGTIEVQSEVDKGSTFTLTIPKPGV